MLLVGGRDRSQDYGPLAEFLAGPSSVVGVVGLPGNGPAILDRDPSGGPVHGDGARRRPRRRGAAGAAACCPDGGGVVLLSPGAPSGPDFGDFETRGEAFRAVVAGH